MQTTKDEFFAFDRTVSRLIEMQSVEYNMKAQVVGAAEDDVETMMEFLELVKKAKETNTRLTAKK